MKRLKEINIPDLPFKEEIINSNFTHLEMRHITANYNYKYNEMYLNPIRKVYPKEFTSLLDNSQLNAIHQCLKYKIGLIQGPPGTGKTHVGTILADILLQNLKPGAQILVVCFTNHALDSFIEGILKYTDNVVRIGGRCKNEIVRKKMLDNKDKIYNKTYKGIINNLESIGVEMKDITALMDVGKRVDYKHVKLYYKELLDKIIYDFFGFINSFLNKNNSGNFNVMNLIDKKKLEDFRKSIYIFWNFIDNDKKRNNFPDQIILDILSYLKIKEDKINSILDNICHNMDGYDKDNIYILNYLNNNNYNEIINNNNIFEENKNNEESEEEDDEEEIQQNLDRLDLDFYNDEIEQKDKDINEIKELSEENEYEINDIKKLTPLNEEKFNYLINNKNINFFRLGPKIIKLIIDYMKNKILLSQLNQQNNYFKTFNTLLTKKRGISYVRCTKNKKF